ncbi:2-hydroxyacid dehydrogenase [Phormidium sp. CLA17]|uniref:2-hydroxyacid dehydrogenase n=1 Tax=Leptolyngbya sp. Cla-17 TaxID=2803751 RepID=UPI001490EF30|nr:2-hydroxyacid dehydrogenase [Leptolyngbya sp. Cla-17]MBM0742784.1 2-hydroxyacid dehydrogenase [Leptolyngbya sp. Cla-17]
MKVAIFSTKSYDRQFLTGANTDYGHELIFHETPLNPAAATLASGCEAVCIFVNDDATADTLKILAAGGTRFIALRCTGFNNVDLNVAAELGIKVVRVTVYSPYSVAEHAVALLQCLNRKIHRAYNRTRDSNFALDGLMGVDLHDRTVGIIGTGKIGQIFAKIMSQGFGCKLLGYDLHPNSAFESELGGKYVTLPELFSQSDVISLHCPLTPENYYLINADAIAQMKPGIIIINTSRGGLVETEAVIAGLRAKHIGALGLDVYEQESELFFEDLSCEIIQDDVIERLLSFPNVIMTGHQAFFTQEAIGTIAKTTLASITEFEQGKPLSNEVKPPEKVPATA